MTQPFVVSLKLIGDASSAVAATAAEERALDSLHQTTNRLMVGQRALGINTANVAAQFQDIGVTAFAGQSPLQIALQQGTQLSAVLGTHGAAGAAATLRAALFSILSPVSLLTIGVVAATAAGIQWLMSMTQGAEDAADALERHSDWLDEILVGYKSARTAAKEAADEALKLPKGAAISDITSGQDAALERLKGQLSAIAAIQGDIRADLENLRLAPDLFGDVIAANEQLVALGVSVNSTDAEFDAFYEHLTLIKNDKAIPEQYRTIAARILEIASAAKQTRAEVDSATAAVRELASLPGVFRGLGVDDGVEQLKKLLPELRSMRERATDIFNTQIGEARTTSEISGLVDAYQETIDALDAKDAQTAAERAAREATRSAKQKSDYDRAIESIRDRTAAQQAELNVIGLSTFAAEKLRVQTQLEIEARKDAIGLSPARIAQIDKEAAAHARLAAQLEQNNEIYATGKDIVTGFVTGIGRAASDGTVTLEEFAETAVSALDKIRDKALGMVAEGIWDLIFGAVMGGGFGSLGNDIGTGAGGFGNIGKFLASAEGKADGGLISGRGTGTSDSNLILASDGEFMVNARATARHRPWLEAINSGRVPGYAAGGYIGTDERLSPASIGAGSRGGSSTTVFNVTTPDAKSFSQSRASVTRAGARLLRRARRYS